MAASPVRAALRARLSADRVRTQARIAALSRDFDAIVEANALVAVDDEHDPEGSSTAFERQHLAALLAQSRAHLEELDAALRRLDDDEYGVCRVCGKAIPAERLEIRPEATTCVPCADAAHRRTR